MTIRWKCFQRHNKLDVLDIGNEKITVDTSTSIISFPLNICYFTTSKEEFILKVFSNIVENYKNHAWLSERAILAAKNKDVYDLSIQIQSQIDGQMYSFKSINSVTDLNEVVNSIYSINS